MRLPGRPSNVGGAVRSGVERSRRTTTGPSRCTCTPATESPSTGSWPSLTPVSRCYRDLPADDYRSVTKHATGNVVAPRARPDAQIVVMLVRSSTYSSAQRLSLGERKLRIT